MRPHPKHKVMWEEFEAKDTVNVPITITKPKANLHLIDWPKTPQ